MNIVVTVKNILPALKYGGTERVVWGLCKALNNMGHKVTIIAAKGSQCPFARVIERNPELSITDQIPQDTDIVHFNTKVPEDLRIPCVLTIHGNETRETLHENSIFVSSNHAQRFGCEAYVYNGLDWDDYSEADLSKARHNYHFLGKAAWSVKNAKGAISVVRKIPGARLDVLGGHRLNLKMGFRFTLSPKIGFKGMVDDRCKKQIIEQSRGLIFPITWHEPFGLVVTESLYFGAPVFATPYGSLSELVTPEVGFLTNSESEMVNFLKDQPEFSPKLCHEYAVEKFSARVMAEAYLAKYEQVLGGQILNPNMTKTDTTQYRDLIWQE